MARIIDVLSHVNVMDDELVYREPQGGNGDFRMGSQVIVQESQAAVFVRQGQVLDSLGSGSHTLSTGNLPILSGLIGMVTSGNNPFTCDVYFVNLKDMPQVGWGTQPPIQMDTPGRSPGFMLLQTHGVIDIGVEDPVRFVKQYAVGKPIVRLENDLRTRIQTVLNETLAGLLTAQKITGMQDANRMLNDLRGASLSMLNDKFAAIGMRIKAFEAVQFSAKDLTPEDMIKYGGDVSTYERVKRLDVAQSAAENQGMAGGLTGAGLGLGIGQSLGGQMDPNQQAMQQQLQQQQMMMQQMMMQMMQQNQQGNQQGAGAAPAAGAPANPSTKEEIQAMLDNLDARFSKGEISEAIYTQLSDKWKEKLKALGG